MNEIPMSLKLMQAILEGDKDAVDRIMAEGIETMTKKYIDIASEYTVGDLPFVVASMQIAAMSIAALLSESGKKLASKIVNSAEYIAADLAEMKKQMEKDGGGADE